MKKILLCVTVTVFFVMANPCMAREWYEGGTLHKATVGQWKNASYSDKLATAGDWAAAMIGKQSWEEISFDQLKIIANDIVICIDEGTKKLPQLSNSPATEVAVPCYMMMQNGYHFLK